MSSHALGNKNFLNVLPVSS